jgi:hypothetical protein
VIPGERYRSILDPYRDSARIIEASDLDYTILRQAWLDDREQIDYATTPKSEPFKNASEVVSRKSVAALVVQTKDESGSGNSQQSGSSQSSVRTAVSKRMQCAISSHQDKRRFLTEARATPPPIFGLMTNSSTVTLESST